jgi:hypothetical protein
MPYEKIITTINFNWILRLVLSLSKKQLLRCADLAARVSVKFKFNSSKRRVEELPLR